MRISDWSSDVCSSDLQIVEEAALPGGDRMAMAGERRRVLFGATDLPLLGGVFRVLAHRQAGRAVGDRRNVELDVAERELRDRRQLVADRLDRKSTRLNSSH